MIATIVLVLVNIVIYVAMIAASGGEGILAFRPSTLLGFGANQSRMVLDGGEVWRLLTSTMIHLNLGHVAMNMIALFQVGRVLEPRWGSARILLAYVVTGLVGSLASTGWYSISSGNTVSAGASGAICGLIGATAIAGHMAGGPHGRAVRNGMLKWALMVVGLGIFIQADNAAHLGGLLSGLLLGAIIERVGIQRQGGRGISAVALVVFLALTAGAFAAALTTTTPLTNRFY